MEGMLAPEMKEEVLGTAEIREIFKISKVGSIAGCMVHHATTKTATQQHQQQQPRNNLTTNSTRSHNN